MARYIDVHKAIERLNASPAFSNIGTDGYFLLGVVEDLLTKQPTADVAPKSEVIKEFVKRFEFHLGNSTFTLGQTNDIQYALKKATEEMKGGE